MTDLIGDIHGHADELERLLQKLGYRETGGAYSHPERKAVFVGDYIDRGPKIKRTLQIVRSMVESGNAVALMGNHEYNALCFHFPETEGGHLRKHLIKNIIQHFQTLEQFQNAQQEYEDHLEWFKTLPLYYETDTFRAVHACWDHAHMDYLKKTLVNGRLNDELIYESARKGSRLYHAVDETLKGKEMKMPDGFTFQDKDGTVRTDMRIKWWEDPAHMTYKSVSVVSIDGLPDEKINLPGPGSSSHYPATDKPVFFGHYWLSGQPVLFKHNVCCLDYSVAKGGVLVAYSMDGEQQLDAGKLTYV